MTQGVVQSTGNKYDMCIEGEGFFQIVKPDGTLAYTRDGSFAPDAVGQLCTSDGYLLQPADYNPSKHYRGKHYP